MKKTYKIDKIDTNVNKDNKENDLQKGQSFNITKKIVNNKTIILPDVNQQSILDSTSNRKLYKIFINNKTETKK